MTAGFGGDGSPLEVTSIVANAVFIAHHSVAPPASGTAGASAAALCRPFHSWVQPDATGVPPTLHMTVGVGAPFVKKGAAASLCLVGDGGRTRRWQVTDVCSVTARRPPRAGGRTASSTSQSSSHQFCPPVIICFLHLPFLP